MLRCANEVRMYMCMWMYVCVSCGHVCVHVCVCVGTCSLVVITQLSFITYPHSTHTLIHTPSSPRILCSLCAVGFVHITNRSPYLSGWLLTWQRRPGCTPHIQVSIPVHHVLSHAGSVIAMFRLILDSDEVLTKLHYGLKWIQGEVKKNQNIRGKFEAR